MNPPHQVPPFDPAMLLLPDEELIAWVWAEWLESLELLADQRGTAPTNITQQMAENIALSMLEMDTDNPAMAGMEKVLKACAGGNIPRAAIMFRKLMVQGALVHAAFDEAATGRRKQRERAKKPRENALTEVIRRIVEQRPGISCPQLIGLN